MNSEELKEHLVTTRKSRCLVDVDEYRKKQLEIFTDFVNRASGFLDPIHESELCYYYTNRIYVRDSINGMECGYGASSLVINILGTVITFTPGIKFGRPYPTPIFNICVNGMDVAIIQHVSDSWLLSENAHCAFNAYARTGSLYLSNQEDFYSYIQTLVSLA